MEKRYRLETKRRAYWKHYHVQLNHGRIAFRFT